MDVTVPSGNRLSAPWDNRFMLARTTPRAAMPPHSPIVRPRSRGRTTASSTVAAHAIAPLA